MGVAANGDEVGLGGGKTGRLSRDSHAHCIMESSGRRLGRVGRQLGWWGVFGKMCWVWLEVLVCGLVSRREGCRRLEMVGSSVDESGALGLLMVWGSMGYRLSGGRD